MTEIVKIGTAEMRLQDCMDYMRGLPDKAFDLAIVDPPYGINFAKKHTGKGWIQRESKEWDLQAPQEEYFSDLFRVSKNQIVWGGNYMTPFLPASQHWIFWDKGQRNFSLADGELAFTSFNKALRVFEMSRGAALAESVEKRFHPTQKPVKLYEWLITNYAKPGQRILDTHLGSMSSVIACLNMGFEIVGCELDADYFKSGVERVRNSQKQQKLFEPMMQGAA